MNIAGIKDDVKSDIDKSKKKLKLASRIISSTSVPSDFKYASKLKNVTGDISSVETKMSDFEKWLDEIVTKFKSAENQNNSMANNIGTNIKTTIESLRNVTGLINLTIGEKLQYAMLGFKEQLGDIANEIETTLLQNDVNCVIDIDNMSNEELKDEIIQYICKSTSSDEFLEFFYIGNGKYGIGQEEIWDNLYYYTYMLRINERTSIREVDPLSQKYLDMAERGTIKLTQVKTSEYTDLVDYAKKTYNMSAKDVAKIISIGEGMCTYSSMANSIIDEFRSKPELFEEKFGFPMYKENDDGKIILNGSTLLLDLYVWANHTDNGGCLITTDENGKNKVLDEVTQKGTNSLEYNDEYNKQYWSNSRGGINEDLLDSYLQSKSSEFESTTAFIHKRSNKKSEITSISEKDMEHIIKLSKKLIESDKQLIINMRRTEDPIRYISMGEHRDQIYVKNDPFSPGSGHSVKVVDMNDEGFIIATWGKKYVIPFEDLQKSGAFSVLYSDITGIENKA